MKKKLIWIGILFSVLVSSIFSFTQAISGFSDQSTEAPYKEMQPQNWNDVEVQQQISDVVTDDQGKWILVQLLDIFGFGGEEYDGVPKAIVYVQNIVNLLLGLTSFIALIIIIYSFYLMFFSEDQKWVDKVKKNLKWVAIALVILGFSWVIVRFVFDFYKDKVLL